MVSLYLFSSIKMKKQDSYLSSFNIKEQGRTAYYKMLESVR